MSISKLICTEFYPSFQKRYLHRAPDSRYMQMWKKSGTDFIGTLKGSGVHMRQSPQLVEQILRVEVAMKEKGLIPFLHAMPAGSKVVMRFAEETYGKAPNRFFKYVRSPTGNFIAAAKEVAKSIPHKAIKQSKPSLLSLSYALTSGIRHLETAASWGFLNHFQQHQYFSLMSQYTAVLPDSKYREMGGDLIRKYNQLKVGDFQVIGIPPEKVEQLVYDSKPFNIPTGKNALDVAKNPEKHADSLFENGTHMATLLVCKEMFDSVTIVTANDREEVEAYCSGIFFRKMSEVLIYQGLVASEKTEFEVQQLKKREEIDRELEKLIALFKEGVIPKGNLIDCYDEFPEIVI